MIVADITLAGNYCSARWLATDGVPKVVKSMFADELYCIVTGVLQIYWRVVLSNQILNRHKLYYNVFA